MTEWRLFLSTGSRYYDGFRGTTICRAWRTSPAGLDGQQSHSAGTRSDRSFFSPLSTIRADRGLATKVRTLEESSVRRSQVKCLTVPTCHGATSKCLSRAFEDVEDQRYGIKQTKKKTGVNKPWGAGGTDHRQQYQNRLGSRAGQGCQCCSSLS